MLPMLCTNSAFQLRVCDINAISALVLHSCTPGASHTSVHSQVAYLSAVVQRQARDAQRAAWLGHSQVLG